MPVKVARPPIQLTDRPVKVNVARAPSVPENTAVPALHDRVPSWVHAGA